MDVGTSKGLESFLAFLRETTERHRMAEADRAEAEAAFAGQGYGIFKPAVAESVIELLRPIREEAERLTADKAYLESVYKDGAQKASYLAEKTLRKVYKKVGFVAR